MDKHFEMVNSDDPREIILGTQRALIESMRRLIRDIQKSTDGKPGLTWNEIDFFLVKFGEKKPEIVMQEHDQ